MARSQPNFPIRHEIKYFVNEGDAKILSLKLARVMRRDEHAGDNGEYFIRSIYFDDFMDSAYYDKIDGDRDRDKYRIRVYGGNENAIYLERKRKRGDLVAKDSVRITARLAQKMLLCDPSRLELSKSPLVQDMFVLMRTRALRPVARVDYWREAFAYPIENARVTFDRRLRAGTMSLDLFDSSPGLQVLDDDAPILEVKFDNHLPEAVALALAGTPANRCAISKYVHCRRYENL